MLLHPGILLLFLATPVAAQGAVLTLVPLPTDGVSCVGASISDDGSLVAVQGKLRNDPSLGAAANADVVWRFELGAPGTTPILAQTATGPIGLRGSAWGAGGAGRSAWICGYDSASSSAFLYSHASNTTQLLPALPGDVQSTPRGVNGNGLVVGRSGPSSGVGAQAVLWAGGTPIGLGFPAGANPAIDSTLAYQISGDDGTVVGVYSARTPRGSIGGIPLYNVDSFPFLWSNGTFTILPNLPHEPSSTLAPREEGVAYAVNGDGTVAVGRSHNGLGRQAFRWTAATGTTGLGFLPSAQAQNSQAEDVSADGRIIVGWSQSDGLSSQSAFLWDPVHGMRRLDTLLQLRGVALNGWELTSASGVSADGQFITGVARNTLGDTRGFVVFLPRDDQQVFEFGTSAPWTGGTTPRCTVDPLPTPGAPIDLHFFDNPPSAPLFWVASFLRQPQPISLTSLGFPAGATLYVDAQAQGALVTDGSGEGRDSIGVLPNDPSFLGQSIFLQSAVRDSALASRIPFAMSRGTEIVIGRF